MAHVLIVDDEIASAEALAALVAREQCSVATAHTLLEARRQILLQRPQLVLLDLQLPDGCGMELFADDALLAHSEVVLITGYASIESSIEALRQGAADYLLKPVAPGQLQELLARFIERPTGLQAEAADLERELAERGRFGRICGRSAAMQRVYRQIARVAGTGVTVFITGESGTGKELVAQTVHELSRRRRKPFVALNCGGISPHLIESELFGHEKGSFTGADRQHQGFFERAGGGTLFLDEVTEMPADLQVKLLHVLETGRFMRVGSAQAMNADVRILAASNRVPAEAVAAGKLREDLFYRLNVFPIEMPPLRERLDDVALLVPHFLELIGAREGEAKRFSAEALARMAAYRWPGNVRELRNVVQRAYVMASGPLITEQWLPTARMDAPPAPPPAREPPRRNDALAIGADTLLLRPGCSVAAAEKALIEMTLRHYRQHKERAAAALGISLKTLYNRLKEYAES
ncbi:sigma-54-dependent transcriptional regulator [Roseateles violae]|uniref:Sigma-54 dependent transcriptional regulator n=1 Tax=Roseateles violae TaxID=3058042 RepID=A0ABT8DVI4_9BURK|nr:sigma-54 dependent transcriptional regulator [Pelomonas sp. PFR6]MDN3922331.1 sigma-54 dependent transcriptional regulator [Pelomonas sp. PFR6]